MNRDSYGTPREVFLSMNVEFNFSADVCASEKNALCQKYITEEMNCLTFDWFDLGIEKGQYVWANVPYSNIGPFVKRSAEMAGKGIGTVMLVMMDQSVGWYKEAVKTCQEVRLVIGGRLSFINPSTGKPVAGNNKGSMFIIWHPFGRTPVQYSHIERDELLAAGRALLEQQKGELVSNPYKLPEHELSTDSLQLPDHITDAREMASNEPAPEPEQAHHWPYEVMQIVDQALAFMSYEADEAFYERLCTSCNKLLLIDPTQKLRVSKSMKALISDKKQDDKTCAA